MTGRPKKGFQRIERPIEIELDGEVHQIKDKLTIRCPICNSGDVRTNGTQLRKGYRIEGFKCANPVCTFQNSHNQGKQFILSSSFAFKTAMGNLLGTIYRKLGTATCSHSEIARDFKISNSLISYMHQKMIQTYDRLQLLDTLVIRPQNDTAIAIDETFLKIQGKAHYIILAVGYSSRKVLAVRVSRTRKTQDIRAVFDEADRNTTKPITVVTADAWNGTQAMIKELNRPITFVIYKHKTPYDKVVIWEVEYTSQERIITKMGIKTDFFKRRRKREYFWRIEREPRSIKRYSIRGRPKGVKNGQGKKPKFVRRNVPTGRKGLFTVFTKGKRGYAKIYPHRKRIKIGGDVPPAVAAAFGRTVELFSEKFVQNNLAENLNSVLSFHLNLSGPKTVGSVEKRLRAFLLVYNHPELVQMVEIRHKFHQRILFRLLQSNPWIPVVSG